VHGWPTYYVGTDLQCEERWFRGIETKFERMGLRKDETSKERAEGKEVRSDRKFEVIGGSK
jgi:hypothetical protein